MRTISLIILFLCALLPDSHAAEPTNDTSKRFIVVVDAGHGGHDAGACGAYSKEKDINLKVALEVGRLLKRNCPDVSVVYTRKTDIFIPLQTRADIANRQKADLFVSIHTNALPKGRIAYGSETYTLGMARAGANLEVAKRENAVITYEKNYRQTYQGFDPNKAESYIIFELLQDRYMKSSVELARLIQQQYVKAGRKNKGVHQAGFLVLRNVSMPAVLTELGFISTPEEERYLNSTAGVQALATGIYNGIVEFRRQQGGSAVPAPSPIALPDPIDTPDEDPTPPKRQRQTKEEAKEMPEKKDTKQPASRRETAADEKQDATEAPVFKVQLMVCDRKLKPADSRLKGLSPVDFYQENGSYKYTYGAETDYNEIRRKQKSIAAKFPGTFIVAFIGGKRTELAAAIRQWRNNASAAKTQKD